MSSRTYVVQICDDCLNLRGEMCHTPECVCIRMTMPEVGELLDKLLIRPVINGIRLPVSYSKSMEVR